MNISSIIVKAAPEHLAEVIEDIISIKLCEVHFYDSNGRIIVTVEGENIDERRESLKQIQNIPYVLDASLMNSFSGDNLIKALWQIEADDRGIIFS